jgi:hypothetical protein
MKVVDKWPLIIAEILYEQQILEKRTVDWLNLSDFEDFIRLEWLEWWSDNISDTIEGFKFIDNIDDYDGENSHKHEFIFEWKGKCYKFVYAYYSHSGIDFSEACMYECEPIKGSVTWFV